MNDSVHLIESTVDSQHSQNCICAMVMRPLSMFNRFVFMSYIIFLREY